MGTKTHLVVKFMTIIRMFREKQHFPNIQDRMLPPFMISSKFHMGHHHCSSRERGSQFTERFLIRDGD